MAGAGKGPAEAERATGASMETGASEGAGPIPFTELVFPGHPAAGWNHRTIISAEIGNSHDGSLGNCYALAEAIANAGADAIKMQCHIGAIESSGAEQFPDRFQFHPQDATRRDYWKRMEFSRLQWTDLADFVHCYGKQLIVSPFCIPALDRIADLADWIKIASGQLDWDELLDAIGKSGKPTVVSTGMAGQQDWVKTSQGWRQKSDAARSEIDRAINDHLRPKRREDCIVLQCTTAYPCPLKWIGLNKVYEFSRQQFVLGGLSDHSGVIWPGIAAAVLGAHMVEVHVCWDKRQFGADASSSLTIDELRQLVEGVRAIEEMRRHPVNKNEVLAQLEDIGVYRDGKIR